jgi:methylthioribose-1-phosphate isomerase
MEELVTMKYEPGKLSILDQTRLPAKSEYLNMTTAAQTAEAIKRLSVRGAPAIGVAAAYGLCLSARAAQGQPPAEFAAAIERSARLLAASRPTAVNLFWAIERMKGVARRMAGESGERVVSAREAEAAKIEAEDGQINRAIGENLLGLLHDGDAVMTHCNAGILATTRWGTALSPFYLAKARGIRLRVYADETRPLLQGARLTAYELMRGGVDVTLICDNMAASVMAQGKIQAVITGCDRVAASGDTANKVGTLGVAVLAKHFGIPFYIAAPTPTIDLSCPNGEAIPIEQRGADEVACFGGVRTAPEGVKVYNPAFDVTPASLITAIVTEKGVVRPPYEAGLKALCSKAPLL